MTKPKHTPDLLTPVRETLQKLTPKERSAVAVAVDAHISTINLVANPRPDSPLGPSYKLVARLYDHLIVKGQKA